MDKNQNLQHRIDQTLNSLDNIQPASPAPFFYTRLEARLMRQDENVWERIGQFITRPSVAFVSVAFVLTVNLFVLMRYTANENISADQQEVVAADEYNRTASVSNYNIDNVQP